MLLAASPAAPMPEFAPSMPQWERSGRCFLHMAPVNEFRLSCCQDMPQQAPETLEPILDDTDGRLGNIPVLHVRREGLLSCPPELVRARSSKHLRAHRVHVCIALMALCIVRLQGGALGPHARQRWPSGDVHIWLQLAPLGEHHLQQLPLRPQPRAILILMHAV